MIKCGEQIFITLNKDVLRNQVIKAYLKPLFLKL
jgi:hypothetical protein